jgi:predicted nucleic acid-binding protein
MICVVDASVAVKLWLPEPLAAETRALFALSSDPASVFHVPDLFFAECANILWKQVQRGNATTNQVLAHSSDMQALPLQRTATFDLVADALSMALAHAISAYDACYVALAVRLQVPLFTADEKLARRFAGTSIAVTWLGNWTPPQAPTP